MKNLGIILLIFSLIMAGVLSYGVYNYLQNQIVPEVEVVMKSVIVAARDLDVNEVITEDMLIVVQKDESFDTSAYYTESEDIIGAIVYDEIFIGESFNKKRLITKEDNFIAVKLEEGHRAVSISVSQFSGVANLLKPGDYVDIIIFISERTEDKIILHPDISKVIMQNVQLLAIKQSFDREYEPGDKADGSYAITLSVKTEDVEGLILAENIGFLKLALRPPGETTEVKSFGTLWQELLTDKNYDIQELYPNYPQGENINIIEKPVEKPVVEKPVEHYQWYTVEYGDTLMSIARKFYNDGHKYTLIKEANNIGNNNLIICGRKLKIPIIE